jgi:hypothetical protein
MIDNKEAALNKFPKLFGASLVSNQQSKIQKRIGN